MTMGRKTLLSAIVVPLIALLAGCASGCRGAAGTTGATTHATPQAYAPHINPADFSTTIDNRYFPLKPGTTFVYQGKTNNATERDVMTVTHSTKQIMGVKCVVVDDRVWAHGELTEKNFDWYAQDKKGNVWYFGENSKEYKNGKVSTETSDA